MKHYTILPHAGNKDFDYTAIAPADAVDLPGGAA
jgi:hypothetical protein